MKKIESQSYKLVTDIDLQKRSNVAANKTASSATKKQLVNAMIKIKGTMIDDGSNISCIAPHGMIWTSSSTHELNIMYERGWKMGEVYHELLQEVLHGVSACEDEACEWCAEGEDLPYGTHQSDCIVINGILQHTKRA